MFVYINVFFPKSVHFSPVGINFTSLNCLYLEKGSLLMKCDPSSPLHIVGLINLLCMQRIDKLLSSLFGSWEWKIIFAKIKLYKHHKNRRLKPEQAQICIKNYFLFDAVTGYNFCNNELSIPTTHISSSSISYFYIFTSLIISHY